MGFELGDFWDKNLNRTEHFKEVSATTCSIGIQGYRKRFDSDQGLGCTKTIGRGMSPGTFIWCCKGAGAFHSASQSKEG